MGLNPPALQHPTVICDIESRRGGGVGVNLLLPPLPQKFSFSFWLLPALGRVLLTNYCVHIVVTITILEDLIGLICLFENIYAKPTFLDIVALTVDTARVHVVLNSYFTSQTQNGFCAIISFSISELVIY